MRDRLIALGMRRPTRIKDEDFDVPMLALTILNLPSWGAVFVSRPHVPSYRTRGSNAS